MPNVLEGTVMDVKYRLTEEGEYNIVLTFDSGRVEKHMILKDLVDSSKLLF